MTAAIGGETRKLQNPTGSLNHAMCPASSPPSVVFPAVTSKNQLRDGAEIYSIEGKVPTSGGESRKRKEGTS